MSTSSDEGELNADEVLPQQSTSTTINDLNYDCLAKIFRYLDWDERLEIETVCKYWKEASKFAWDDGQTAFNFNGGTNGSLTHDMKKVSHVLPTTKEVGRILMRYGARVKELDIGPPLSGRILSLVHQYCSNLRELGLNFNLSDGMFEFFSNMERLESLKMKCYARFFSAKHFATLPQILVKLSIHLHCMEKPTTSTTASAFSENLQNLRHFELIGWRLDNSMIEAISEKAGLTHLSFECCHIPGDLTFLRRMENLQHLKLRNIRPFQLVDDNFVIQLAECCQQLKSLHLSKLFGITDRGITDLQKLNQLEDLSLRELCDITDEPLGRMFQLEKLDCCHCQNVGDAGIIRLIKNAPKLEKLNVAYCRVTEAVIVEALEVTRERHSLPLEIVTSLTMQRDVDADKAYSPLLTITSVNHHSPDFCA